MLFDLQKESEIIGTVLDYVLHYFSKSFTFFKAYSLVAMLLDFEILENCTKIIETNRGMEV